MENNFYLILFMDENDNYIAVEVYGSDKEKLRAIALSKINRMYGYKYNYHSIRKLDEPSKFIYIENLENPLTSED